MDFDLTEEQSLLKSSVSQFLESEIAPQVAEYEAKGPLSREETITFIKQLMPFGYYNGRMSEEYGGSNLDAKTYGVLQEELSRIWPALCGTIWIAGGSEAPEFLSDADQRDFTAFCRKNGLMVNDFRDRWTDFSEFLSYLPTLKLYGQSPLLAFALPVAAGLYTLMTIDSARRSWQGQGANWKGRTYS